MPLANGDEGFGGFAIARGILLTKPLRLADVELVPFRWGEDAAILAVVNPLLAEEIHPGFSFGLNDLSGPPQTTPYVTFRFQNIPASSIDEASRHVIQRTERLLQVLPLTRGASGEMRAAVIIDRKNKATRLFPITGSYRGNLLGGFLSGEVPEYIDTLSEAIRQSSQWSYFLSLYREAIAESSDDFRLVRFWAVLEAIAESKDFPRDPMTDLSGKLLLDEKGNRILIKDSETRVYTLLKRLFPEGVSETYSLSLGHNLFEWNLRGRVRVWHDARNAVAHYGSIRNALERQAQAFRYLKDAIDVGGYELLAQLQLFLRDDCGRLIEHELTTAQGS